MAGGITSTGSKNIFAHKQKHSQVSNSEKILESQPSSASTSSEAKKTVGLSGILSLNKSIDIHQSNKESWSQEFIPNYNHLIKEENLLLDNRQQEIKNSIKELQQEIKKLISSSQGINREVEKATLQPVIEISEYQLHFLDRLKNLIINFRKSISEASLWLESFHTKKYKKNAFWSKVKSKKGGEQYLNSGEHSASRSIN